VNEVENITDPLLEIRDAVVDGTFNKTKSKKTIIQKALGH
jgi:hypothetical protein